MHYRQINETPISLRQRYLLVWGSLLSSRVRHFIDKPREHGWTTFSKFGLRIFIDNDDFARARMILCTYTYVHVVLQCAELLGKLKVHEVGEGHSGVAKLRCQRKSWIRRPLPSYIWSLHIISFNIHEH